jgi:MFS family permease
MMAKGIEPWRKNLYIMWASQFMAMIGMNLVVPFLPFYIRDLGVRADEDVVRWSGLVFSGPFLFSFFLTPVWGNLGDRYGRKLMVVRAIFGLALSQVLIGLSPNVEMLFFFRLLQGAISGFIPAALALVSATTPQEKSGYALGILQTATASGTVIGPVIGGPLADALGYRPTFFIVAALCVVAGILIVKTVEDEPIHAREAEPWPILLSNYRHAFHSRPIRLALGVIFLSQMAVLMIQPVFALYIEMLEPDKEYLATMAGVFFSVAGIFMVISSPWWGKRADAKGYKANLVMAIVGTAIAHVAQGFVTHAYHLIFWRALQGFCMGGILPTLYSYISRNTSLVRRGGIMGIAASCTILASMVGPVASGYIAAHLGIRQNFFVTGEVLAVAALLVWRFFIEGREPTQPQSYSHVNAEHLQRRPIADASTIQHPDQDGEADDQDQRHEQGERGRYEHRLKHELGQRPTSGQRQDDARQGGEPSQKQVLDHHDPDDLRAGRAERSQEHTLLDALVAAGDHGAGQHGEPGQNAEERHEPDDKRHLAEHGVNGIEHQRQIND